jgi:AraC-like DNA-binding protein
MLRSRVASTLDGAMATQSELVPSRDTQDFHVLFQNARRQVIDGAANVREVRLELDGPPLRAHSRMLSSGGLFFVLGENLAGEDLMLRYESAQPLVAVHAPLRGSAAATMDGLGSAVTGRAGELQLFVSPSSSSTVRLHAYVKNQAFRVAVSPALVRALAERHSELEGIASHVVAGTPFCAEPTRALSLQRVQAEAGEIFDSEQYGAIRPMFLEARALSWFAMALAGFDQRCASRLVAREVERMHEARDLLSSRLDSPPTLAEIATAVGTNDFALKRNFKAVFGQPVYSYMLSLRLAQARRLLLDTSMSVKEIAAAVGYVHCNHFSTAYRRAYGVSPGSFRKTPRRR